MSIVIDVYQQFRPGAHHIFYSKEATKPTTMGYLLARLTSTGHVLQKHATEDRMTAATVVIHAGCERTGWLEFSTGSHETLDEVIRLAGFGVNASRRLSRGLSWGLSDHDVLVTGLGPGDRGQSNEEHHAKR